MSAEFDVAGGKFQSALIGLKMLIGLGPSEGKLEEYDGETIIIELKPDTTIIVADLISNLLNEHALKVSIRTPST